MKKKIIIATTAALIGAMLAGCGSNNATSAIGKLNTDNYVTLGQYTGYEASAAEPVVSDAYVETYINYILQSGAQLEEVTGRSVESGDTVSVDYVGKKDDVAFEGGTGTNDALVIGSGAFIPGFEEGLIGMNVGETKELDLTFPEGYKNAEMAGQAVVFTVTVQAIKTYAVPELTDEYVAGLGGEYQTVEEFRQYVRSMLEEQAQSSFDTAIEDSLMEQIMAACTWKEDVPEEIVQDHIARIRRNLEAYAEYSNVSFAEVLYYQYGIQESEFETSAREGAIESAKETIVLQAIANEQKLNPTQKELDQLLEEEAKERGYDSVDKYKEVVGEAYYGEYYRDYQMVRRALDYIKENSTIHETAAEIIDEGEALPEETQEAGTEPTEETEQVEETEETQDTEAMTETVSE